MKLVFLLFPLLTSAYPGLKNDGMSPLKLHALLVAGSNGIENYRHQADVAHAYHLLIAKGVPSNNIVVMMYDDVAGDPRNPTPGQLRNAPNGPDYYKELKIDYRLGDVNVDNFVAVLTGDSKKVKGKSNNKRVLHTTKDDNIFLFYADHGAPGFVSMPTGKVLTKGTLQDAIKKANFGQLSVYIEACEAASMLAGMENDLNVFGLTASTATQPSYACNCNGGFCYGDEFSVQWITDSEKNNLNKLGLVNQFSEVSKAVRGSTVCRFGNVFLNPIPVSHFQGEKGGIKQGAGQFNLNGPETIIPARDVPLYYYRTRAETASSKGEREEALDQIDTILQKRKLVDSLLHSMANQLQTRTKAVSNGHNTDCRENLTKQFEDSCHPFGQSPYLAGRMVVFAEWINEKDCSEVMTVLEELCKASNFAEDKAARFL